MKQSLEKVIGENISLGDTIEEFKKNVQLKMVQPINICEYYTDERTSFYQYFKIADKIELIHGFGLPVLNFLFKNEVLVKISLHFDYLSNESQPDMAQELAQLYLNKYDLEVNKGFGTSFSIFNSKKYAFTAEYYVLGNEN